MDFNYNVASSSAFVVAVTQNFLLNKRWTFSDHDKNMKNMFIKYFALNFFSFLLNLAILNLVIYFFGTDKAMQIIAQLLGIGGAMASNFAGSHRVVFRTHRKKSR